MPVTSNSLFHFTNSRKGLEGILKERFRVTYCKEEFCLAGGKSEAFYFPMISFCDIPLGSIKDHISKYGCYGIGMSKTWGIKKGLNPVLYLEKESNISKNVGSQFDNMFPIISDLWELLKLYTETSEETNDEVLNAISTLREKVTSSIYNFAETYRFIKNYQGDLETKKGKFKNYRFYDEREWRFVPEAHIFIMEDEWEPGVLKWTLNPKEYEKYRGNDKKKPKPFIGLPLDFDSSDIKYLIVKKENDVSQLINVLKSVKGLCSTPNDFDLLVTKIITVDSLNEDF